MHRNIHCQACRPRARTLLASTGGTVGSLIAFSTTSGVKWMMIWLISWVVKIPMTMANWNNDVSRPRRCAGAASEMYIGDTTAARPIAKPPTMRQNMKSAVLNGNACPTPATRKRIAEVIITLRRPNLSVSRPPMNAPTADPSRATATTKPCMNLSVSWNS